MSKQSPGTTIDFPIEELLKQSSIIFYHCDIEAGFPVRYMSPNVEDILGFRAEKFKENDTLWVQRIHEEDRDRVLQTYKTIPEEGGKVIEFRFHHADGHYLWLRDEVKLVKNEEDDLKTIVGSSIEITEQKQAEQQLRELNKTLEKRIGERTSKLSSVNQQLKEQHETMKLQEMAISNINDMVVLTKAPVSDPLNSKIIYVNKAFEEFTGYSSGYAIGRKPTFLHGPQTSQRVLNQIEQKVKNHESLRVEFINYKKDGTPYWVELDMSPFPSPEKNYEYWVGINRDITQRKRAEQKLEENEKRYRAFAELSFDAIFEVDLDGIIKNCNKRACEMFGYSREELIGMNTRELRPDEYQGTVSDIDASVTTGDEAWERMYRKKDGTLLPTEIHTKLYQVGGEKRLIAYVRDNSVHKEYEDTIRKSLKEKETLLAEVHHRVKNNLAIISGLLEMQAFNTEDEQLLDKLSESQSRIHSIAMVHEQLYSSDSFSEIALDKYIDDLVKKIIDSMSDTQKEIRVNKNMESIHLKVSQAVPCGLLLNELITNSYKHAFTNRDKGQIDITLQRHDHTIALSVADNGRGLPDGFSMEEQSSLGMTLIETLIMQLDGDLEISSQDGARFEITFEIEE